MPTTKQRGSLVIYVAGSARELPAEVQDWLGRAESRAVASPHIYDMLAQLAQGKKFNAVIVNIQSVDWNEMDFFEQAARLCRGTPVYVAGPYAQRAKIEAACRHGARLFDAVALTEAATASTAEYPGWDWPAQQNAPVAPIVSPAPVSTVSPVPSEPTPTNFTGGLKLWVTPDEAKPVAGDGNGRCSDVSSEVEPIQAAAQTLVAVPVVMPVEAEVEEEDAVIESLVSDDDSSESSAVQADAKTDSDVSASEMTVPEGMSPEPVSSSPEIQSEPRSMFRLAPVEEEPESRVMFPWSAYPDRPRRIPPRSPEPSVPSSAREVGGVGGVSQSASAASSLHVRLTPEEIAALMGNPPRSDQAREAP